MGGSSLEHGGLNTGWGGGWGEGSYQIEEHRREISLLGLFPTTVLCISCICNFYIYCQYHSWILNPDSWSSSALQSFMLSSHTHVYGPGEISHYLGDWPVMSFVFVCTLYNTYYHVFCVCVKNTYYHVFCVYIAQNKPKPKLQITFVNQSFSHHYQGVNQEISLQGKRFSNTRMS